MPTRNDDGTTLTGLSGYRIFYGTSANNLTQSVTVSGANVTSHTITGLVPGTYFFAITSLTSSGASSDISNAASMDVP